MCWMIPQNHPSHFLICCDSLIAHTSGMMSNILDPPRTSMEKTVPWVTVILVGGTVMVLLPYVLGFAREVWLDWKLTTYMRKLGYSGPSVSVFKNDKKEMEQLALKAPSVPPRTSNGDLNHDFGPRLFPHLHTWRKLYGEKFIFHHGSKLYFHTSDPDASKEIFARHHDYKRSTAALHILGQKGLVYSEHEEWARQRAVVRSAFYPDRAKKLVVRMASWIEIWLRKLDNLIVESGGSLDIDIDRKLHELSEDILARSSFGSSFERGKEGFQHLEKHKDLLIRRGYIWNPFYRWIPGALEKEISRERGEELVRWLREIIRDRRNSIHSGSYESYGDDLLGLLLADRDRRLALDGRPPGELENEDEHILDQCRTFFFAGADTVGSMVLWAIVLLGHYIDWQERIRAEVQEVFHGISPDGDQLMKLKQLTMFLEETLRLYPSAAVVTREIHKDNITLGGELMPKHLSLVVNQFAIHRDKELWGDDALEFKPERFKDGIAKACKKSNAFSPFGWGPRICVALPFAMTEMKLILAMLVQRFSFTLSPSYRHEPSFGMGLAPKFSVQIVLEHVKPVKE